MGRLDAGAAGAADQEDGLGRAGGEDVGAGGGVDERAGRCRREAAEEERA